MLCAPGASKWQRNEKLPTLPAAEPRAKSGRNRKKADERYQWLCTSQHAVQDRPGPSQLFDSIPTRVQRHQGYSAFDRSDQVFTSKEASGIMSWMTH